MIMELLCQAGETGREGGGWKGVEGGGEGRWREGREGRGFMVGAFAIGCPGRMRVAIGMVV